MLTREKRTRGPGTSPVFKGLVWCTDESRMRGGTRAGVYWQFSGRRLNISLGMYATVAQSELCAILACAHEIQTNAIP